MNGLCSILSSKAVDLRKVRVECACGADFSRCHSARDVTRQAADEKVSSWLPR
jgi:hypothetical protein